MMRKDNGFTLIEVIASMIIVGILASIAGMGIVTGIRAYLQTKENAHMAQKAQVAMVRIQRELMELTAIETVNTTDPFVIFDNPVGRQAIARVGNTLQLYTLGESATDLSGSTGDVLVDQAAGLTIAYFQGSAVWTSADSIDLLSAIQVSFDLQRREGSANSVSFSTTIHPRNTNNFGGAAPTTEPISASRYDCFIAVAADNRKYPSPGVLRFSAGNFILVLIFSLPAVMFRRRLKAPVNRSMGRLQTQKGSVLVGLVVTMLIFAALGAGMVSMTSTSTTSQVVGNDTAQAYYLAESGFRYAASQYLNTTDGNNRYGSRDEKNQLLNSLHDQVFTLAGGEGQFRLKIFPYYFSAKTDHVIGNTSMQTQFSGGTPANFIMPPASNLARIKIDDTVYTYTSYNSVTGVFGLPNPGLAQDVYANAVIKPVGIPNSVSTMSNNGDLVLASGTFFPELQGKFTLDGVTYAYTRRNADTLVNITDANDPSRSFSKSVDSTDNLVLEPFLQVHSIGIAGQSSLTATREVVYNVPLPADPMLPNKVEFHDGFNDSSHLNTPTHGDFSVTDVGGDSALKVTNVSDVALSPKAALISVDWTTTPVNFASAHRMAGYFLSYDAQTKIGFDGDFTAGSWSDFDPDTNAPDGLPKFFMGGITFRLEENLNTYGIGFTRGSNSIPPISSDIEPALVPQDQTPMVVLWQHEGASHNWLAYSGLPGSIVFFDDMESGTSNWAAEATWDQTTIDSHSPTHSWTDSPGANYANNADASLISTLIDLSGLSSALLSFRHKYDFVPGDADYGYVEISPNGGPWTELARFDGDQLSWGQYVVDLDPILPVGNVSIRFRIQTDGANTDGGWWVDDVKITTKEILDFSPDHQGTLMVRVIEAAVIDFTSGGTTEIEAGDTVTQSNGAIGKVVFAPTVNSGSWSGGDAAGMIWLNNTTTTDFVSGTLDVAGKGNNLATVAGYRPRTNLIKAYFNSASTIDSGSVPADYDNPYDLIRLANPRGTLKWPADEGLATDDTNDHFTLLEWDIDINDSAVPSVQPLKDENGKYTIISIDTLSTPSDTYFPFTRPEIGLFALGHGATRMYFDDLGIQLYVVSGAGFLTPIQQ